MEKPTDPVHDVLFSYDLSVLILQWLRIPDLIAYGGACSASRAILFLHLQRLRRLPSTELPGKVSSEAIRWINSHAPNLTDLSLHACNIAHLASHSFVPSLSSQLRELHLTHIFTSALHAASAPPLPSLVVLNLSDSTYEYQLLTNIVWNAPALEVLRLRGSTTLPRVGGDELLYVLHGRLTLRTLDISFSSFTGVSPTAVRLFAENCPGIWELGLTYVMQFREVSFIFRIFADSTRHALRSLSLGDIDANFNDFVNFMRRCTTLQRLHLICCASGMGSEMITAGLLQSQSITDLNLTGNDMQPQEITAILTHCSGLRRVCLLGDMVPSFRPDAFSFTSTLRELSVDLLSLGYVGGNMSKEAHNLVAFRCSSFSGMDVAPELYLPPIAEHLGSKLRVLAVSLLPQHLSGFFEILKSFTALRLLMLPSTKLGTPDVETIVRSCPRLRWLCVWLSLFSGPDSALLQLRREYSFRVVGIKEEADDLGAFDHALYDDYGAQELWID